MVAYELSVIGKANIPATKVYETLKAIVTTVTTNGGVVKALESTGVRPLAQPKVVEGERLQMGRFFLLQLETKPSVLEQVRAEMKRDQNTVFHSFVKTGDGIPSLKRLRKANREVAYVKKMEGLRELARTAPIGYDAAIGSVPPELRIVPSPKAKSFTDIISESIQVAPAKN